MGFPDQPWGQGQGQYGQGQYGQGQYGQGAAGFQDPATYPIGGAPQNFGEPGVFAPDAFGQAGYPQSGGPGYPQPGFAPQRNNPLAITSLICGCAQFALWFFILIPGFLAAVAALITGVLALKQIRTRGESGQGMAIAGIVLGALGVFGGILWILLFAASVTTSPSPGY